MYEYILKKLGGIIVNIVKIKSAEIGYDLINISCWNAKLRLWQILNMGINTVTQFQLSFLNSNIVFLNFEHRTKGVLKNRSREKEWDSCRLMYPVDILKSLMLTCVWILSDTSKMSLLSYTLLMWWSFNIALMRNRGMRTELCYCCGT